MEQIQQPSCDCQHHKPLYYLCIHPNCQFNRRLCPNCKTPHTQHQLIEFQNNSSLNHFQLNSKNPSKNAIEKQLLMTMENLENLNNKIFVQIHRISDAYQNYIVKPFELLIGSTQQKQRKAKRAAIANKTTPKEDISAIVRQLNALDKYKQKFQNLHWLKSLNQYLQEQYKQITTEVHNLIQKICSKIQHLFPFSDILQDAIQQKINEQEKEQQKLRISEKHKMQTQQQEYIIQFLNNLQKKSVIGTYKANNKATVMQWIQSNKNARQIIELDLSAQKLYAIPKEILFFRKLVYLDIGNNYIEKIQNIENLTQLINLGLANNLIEKIENIDHLVNLQALSMAKNRILTLKNMPILPKLKNLILFDNPFLKKQQQSQYITRIKQQGTKLYLVSSKK